MTDTPTKLKRGQPSDKELTYIADNADLLTVEQIAANLKRSVDFVKERIAQLPKRQQIAESNDLISQLHASPTWIQVKRTLMPNEITHFEHEWARYIRQFSSGADIVASDETMIKDLIILDILATRAMAEVRNNYILIEQLEKLLESEAQKAPEVRDQVAMQGWRDQVTALQTASKPLTERHIDYQKSKDAKLTQLKATRQARFKELIESKQNIFSLLLELNTIEKRIREGRQMEKMRIASDKEQSRLGELTTYEDETVDKPFLSPEGELEDERLQNESGQESSEQ